jgi:hypothetical protein
MLEAYIVPIVYLAAWLAHPADFVTETLHTAAASSMEISYGASTRLILDRLLQIVVEIFIRVVFRRIGREIKDLDFDLVARQLEISACTRFALV